MQAWSSSRNGLTYSFYFLLPKFSLGCGNLCIGVFVLFFLFSRLVSDIAEKHTLSAKTHDSSLQAARSQRTTFTGVVHAGCSHPVSQKGSLVSTETLLERVI